MDRLKTMDTFVRVVRAGSFAGAATQLGISRAIVSRHLQDLEDFLGTRLFNRTTRRLGLTATGSEFYGFCLRILEDIESQRRSASRSQHEPCGRIKVMAPKSFGNLQLGPAVAEFIEVYPDVHIALMLSDDSLNTYDLIESGFDLAIRLSPVEESSVISRRIGQLQWMLCASPEYLARNGAPRIPSDLVGHNCLVHLRSSPDSIWRLRGKDGEVRIKVSGSMSANSSLALSAGALKGLGIALLPAYCIQPDLETGRLVEVLPAFRVPKRPIFALYPHRRNQPHAARLFIEFLSARLQNGSVTTRGSYPLYPT